MYIDWRFDISTFPFVPVWRQARLAEGTQEVLARQRHIRAIAIVNELNRRHETFDL